MSITKQKNRFGEIFTLSYKKQNKTIKLAIRKGKIRNGVFSKFLFTEDNKLFLTLTTKFSKCLQNYNCLGNCQIIAKGNGVNYQLDLDFSQSRKKNGKNFAKITVKNKDGSSKGHLNLTTMSVKGLNKKDGLMSSLSDDQLKKIKPFMSSLKSITKYHVKQSNVPLLTSLLSPEEAKKFKPLSTSGTICRAGCAATAAALAAACCAATTPLGCSVCAAAAAAAAVVCSDQCPE